MTNFDDLTVKELKQYIRDNSLQKQMRGFGTMLKSNMIIKLKLLDELEPSVKKPATTRRTNAWILALKEFNKDKTSWCVPRSGSPEYLEVKKIQEKMKVVAVKPIEPKVETVVTPVTTPTPPKVKTPKPTQAELKALDAKEERESKAKAKEDKVKAKAKAKSDDIKVKATNANRESKLKTKRFVSTNDEGIDNASSQKLLDKITNDFIKSIIRNRPNDMAYVHNKGIRLNKQGELTTNHLKLFLNEIMELQNQYDDFDKIVLWEDYADLI
jgi:hypothetical protein